MTRVLSIRPRAASSAVRAEVRRLLVDVDAEFVPPLSERGDTLALLPRVGRGERGLDLYFDALEAESWLVALACDQVVGFLSFLPGHEDPWLAGCSPALYATTVAVAVRARGVGIGGRLYDAFEAEAERAGVPYLTTRTWTTNSVQLDILRERGYREVARLPDDRGAGVGTVYLAYRIEGDPSRSPVLRTRR